MKDKLLQKYAQKYFFKIKMKDKLLQYQQKLCVEKKLLDKLLLKCHQKHYCVKKKQPSESSELNLKTCYLKPNLTLT